MPKTGALPSTEPAPARAYIAEHLGVSEGFAADDVKLPDEQVLRLMAYLLEHNDGRAVEEAIETRWSDVDEKDMYDFERREKAAEVLEGVLGGVDDALNVHPLVGPVIVAARGAETGALAFSEKMKRSQVSGAGGDVGLSIPAGQGFVAIVQGIECRKIPGNRVPVGPETVKLDKGRVLREPGVVGLGSADSCFDFRADILVRGAGKIGKPTVHL